MIASGAIFNKEWRGRGEHRHEMGFLTIGGMKLEDHENGKITLYPGDILAEVPEMLQEFVIEVSCYDNFGYELNPPRRIGYYRLASAVAELEVIPGERGSRGHYHMKIRAKRLSDLRELRRLILQGQIWPAIDYESRQVPPPYRHFRNLVSEMWQLIRRDVRDRLFRIRERVLG